MPEERVIDDRPTGVFVGVGSSQAATQARVVFGARGTRRRRLWIVLSAVVLVLISGGLATGLTLRHLDHQYGPLTGGDFFGIYSGHGFVFGKNGFSYHLASAPDSTGQLIASLDNLGAHSVRITSIETDPIVTKIEWSVYRVVSGGSVDGVRTPWRPFPAVVPAHGTIRLLITIHHPNNCSEYPRLRGVSDDRYLPVHWVRWESLLHSHRPLVELWNDPAESGIAVC